MIKIREAKFEDVKAIMSLVKELAEFEKLAHEFVADERTFGDNLFGPRASTHALIAELDGRAIGFALYFFNFSTFLGRPGLYLEDLYVQPEQRGSGVGLSLLSQLAVIAKERNCGRMEWSVLDWNQKAIDFYLKLGARPMSEWTTYRLTAKEIDSLAAKSR